jgi:dephospho-CoA kinase
MTSLPPIIGLLGRSRRGKDTIAEYIIKKYPVYKNIKLAKPIKDAARSLYDFTYEQVEGAEKEIIDRRWNITPRDALVFITTSFMNKMGTDFFTRRLFDNLAIDDKVIISDLRYQNDIEEIKKRNGIVIKVLRDIEPNHNWESHIDNFTDNINYTINNNGSLKDLYNQIDQII